MIRTTCLAILGATALASPALAEDISTHVLNTATGEGGAGVPVTLEMQGGGGWTEIATATTEQSGRVANFGIDSEEATYRLRFDMTQYDAFGDAPFFPEITVTFQVSDTGRHHHVPVLVSPYGYSTYLGN